MQDYIQKLVARLASGENKADEIGVLQRGDELTLDIADSAAMREMMRVLRDEFHYQQLLDIAGMDYADYHQYQKPQRYAAVYHLLSLTENRRLRVRFYCPDNDFPALQTVTDLWPAAGWYEREAFDLFGIVFHGHEDLRRILTDYGFIGHPFRKDFPLSGHVEMRYDPTQKRVIYQPVSIPEREVVPRVVREEKFAQDDRDG